MSKDNFLLESGKRIDMTSVINKINLLILLNEGAGVICPFYSNYEVKKSLSCRFDNENSGKVV